MIRLVAAGLLLGWIPGARASGCRSATDSRERLEGDERAFWAVVLSGAWSTGARSHSPLLARTRSHRLLRRRPPPQPGGAGPAIQSSYDAASPRVQAVVPALLFGFALWLYHPAAEYIIGGKDPGVYVERRHADRPAGRRRSRGNDLVKSVPRDLRGLFMPAALPSGLYGVRFMGFFVTNPRTARSSASSPISIRRRSIGYGLDGLTGARHVSSLCAALGVVALFFLASRLVGRPAAAVAGVLLAVNVVQVWFARYPNSEIVAQVLILAGMLAFARAYIDGDRVFGPVAALLLGLSLFARIDGVFAIAAACAAAILLRLEGRPRGISFFGPTIATAAAGWLYFSRILAPYTQRPIGTAKQHRSLLGALAAGVAAVYVATGRKAIAPFLHGWIPRALTVVLVGLAIYAFFFRVPSGRLAVHDANALRTYAWYVHPAALGVALIGLCLVTWKRFWRIQPGCWPSPFTACSSSTRSRSSPSTSGWPGGFCR